MEFKDYYQALGVDKTASVDDIKKAFRRLARKYHPDVSKVPDAAARMSEINEANTVLSDPEKRAAYDSLGQRRAAGAAGQDFRPPPDWDEGFEFSGAPQSEDFSEFFANLFSRTGRASRGTRPPGGEPPHLRGEDHHAKIAIDLRDAYEGAAREIRLRAPRLDANGHVVLDERTLQVHIPKGMREGQQIRLAGQGSPGYGGAPAGDLFLEVHFNPDPRWQVEGRDVTLQVPVAPWEAALGGRIEVPTPSGTVEVSVPAASKNGRKLRLRGRGIPGDPPGDLYLQLELVLPPVDNDQARRLFETMARELAFDPRRGMGA
jgi:curved DNA-binding protein